MDKDFQKWHFKKSDLHKNRVRPSFHEREVWFCYLGINIGFEQDGKGELFGRPVIIFRKFNNQVFWAIPLTTKIKRNIFHLAVDLKDSIFRMAILSQLRLIDSKRLYQKIGFIDERTKNIIEKNIISLCKSRQKNQRWHLCHPEAEAIVHTRYHI